MERLRIAKKIGEDTKIAFENTEKFVRLGKVLQKVLKDIDSPVKNVEN